MQKLAIEKVGMQVLACVLVAAFPLLAAGDTAAAPLPEEGTGLITSSGRAYSLIAIAVGLVSVVLGGLALSRRSRSKALAALAAGVIGVLISVFLLAISAGAVGTGNGRGGTILALLLALIGTALGGIAMSRSQPKTRSVGDR